MQAVLFPVTYVSETVFEAVKTCFQQVLVYQPTRRQVPSRLQMLSQRGLIELRIPDDSDEKKLETLVSGYRNWAALHEGAALDYLKLQQRSFPFFDDTSISKIRTDIRQAAAESRSAGPPPEPLFNARVFLQIAQEYDLQTEEVGRKLAAAREAERKLFAGITGEAVLKAEEPGSEIKEASDLSGRMIEARMTAWTRLFMQDRPAAPPKAPTAFVAVHRAVFDFLLERTPAAEEILHVRSIPLMDGSSENYAEWQNRFGRILDSLPEDAGAVAAELIAGFHKAGPVKLKADLKLYRIPGEPPASFFARCVGRPSLPEADRPDTETLLGLVEMV